MMYYFRLSLLALAIGSMFWGNRAGAVEAVLLATTVPGLSPGMVIGGADTLSVPDGGSLTLLLRSGEVLRLRGPVQGTMTSFQTTSGNGSAAVLADALRLRGVDASVIGGTRAVGVGRPPRLDELTIDPTRSATYCLLPDTQVWVASPASGEGSYAVRRKSTSNRLIWSANSARVEWPSGMPIEDGDRYQILRNGASLATLTFQVMQSFQGPPERLIAEAILLGCRDQFSAALASFARTVVMPELRVAPAPGHSARLRRGESLTFAVESNVDGYLYCVATLPSGLTVPLFPGDAVDGPLLRASMPMMLPGVRRSFLTQSSMPGTMLIRCWMADRDISPELPHALLDANVTPLPDSVAGDLPSLFNSIGGSHLASSTLELEVE